ncbi:MAG: mechanosensitive ion channel family protein [Deltaproteobacteria bacterium]|nr:MAG: mechanosensitive ion channel family protein [Deltaproteobacteria bacterium]
MKDILINWNKYATMGQIVFTLGILLIAFLIRLTVNKILENSKTIMRENKRRMMVNTNSTLSFLVFIGMILIWSTELRELALSLAAIAVAGVIATKELIMCFTGTMYKASNNVCSVGDWIEINGYRGIIVDKTVTATMLMEIGPGHSTSHYTGRVITIPNSLFVTYPTKNESIFRKYALHSFAIPLTPKSDHKVAKEILLAAATDACSSYLEEAKNYISRLQDKAALDVPELDPKVRIYFKSHEEIQLICRLIIPTVDIVAIEQKIKSRFLDEFKGWG